jgi:putative endonuclease
VTRKRKHAEKWGRWAEFIAIWWLRAKGYRLLEHRARTAAGEIDLVFMRGEYLVFVEVKARTSIEVARQSLTPRQRDRIIRAASLWLARHSGYSALHMRYDMFLVAAGRWPVHERAAWIPEGRAVEGLL